MQQPYGAFAKALLERQIYPELRRYPGGPLRRPYDATAHTLPLLLGVDVGTIEHEGAQPLNPPRRNSSRPTPPSTRHPLRIALYRSHVPSMDEGWTRWVLEQSGIPYTSAGNVDILSGALRERYDVILFPDQSPDTIQHGFKPGTMPPEYCGGLGDGIRSLRDFVRDGGSLVFLNRSTEYAIERFDLKLKNVVRGLPETEYYSPGSLLNVALDTSHPLARGLPEDIAIWSEASPAWEVRGNSGARIIARYPAERILASGWLTGEKHLAGKAALVEVRAGRGRLILFGFRPQYRGQTWQTMKLLFNAL
jgi:hypothetical protein